jgi:hypothetical protein
MKKLYIILAILFASLVSWGQITQRGNTVGLKTVAGPSYLFNNNPTTRTVGASGADFTALNLAIDASVAGDVIEIIDDTLILSAQDVITTGLSNGVGLKIKGKSTKTVIQYNGASSYVFLVRGALELENIILKDITGRAESIWVQETYNGILRAKNCEFQTTSRIRLGGVVEAVFDNCTFDSCYVFMNATANNDTSRVIINDCDANSADNFVEVLRNNGYYNYLSVTNSRITSLDYAIDISNVAVQALDSFNISGNYFNLSNTSTGTSMYIGYGITDTVVTGVDNYNSAITYNVGDLTSLHGQCWENIQSSTGIEPNLTNPTYWRYPELITGRVENNLITKDAYSVGTHGLAIFIGAHNVKILNNIISKAWFGIVVKGHENTIAYNAVGNSFNSLSIFPYDQNSVHNNTVRNDIEYALLYGPTSPGGIGVDNTPFYDNIFDSDSNFINDRFNYQRNQVSLSNTFTQNIYASNDVGESSYEDTMYVMSSELNDFKLATGDNDAAYFSSVTYSQNENDTLPTYYLPISQNITSLSDQNNEAVGAVDYFEPPIYQLIDANNRTIITSDGKQVIILQQ